MAFANNIYYNRIKYNSKLNKQTLNIIIKHNISGNLIHIDSPGGATVLSEY